jgi:hypothetical protein
VTGRRWEHHASAAVLESDRCRLGNSDPTSVDRRWLWRLESFLSVSGTTDGHRTMASDLHQYLNETCGHHWHKYAADGDIAAHSQCTWCNDVRWADE